MRYPDPQKEARVLIWLHILEAIFTVVTFVLAIARLAYYGGPRSRLDVWVVTVSVKSMIVLIYIFLTGHVAKARKWSSLKANMILGMLEFVFWFAAMVVSCMGISKGCSGAGCTYGGLLIFTSQVLIFLSFPTACIHTHQFRHRERDGYPLVQTSQSRSQKARSYDGPFRSMSYKG